MLKEKAEYDAQWAKIQALVKEAVAKENKADSLTKIAHDAAKLTKDLQAAEKVVSDKLAARDMLFKRASGLIRKYDKAEQSRESAWYAYSTTHATWARSRKMKYTR